jgi:hypothetical protein
MGYTTSFEGRFELDRLPHAEVIVQINALSGADGRELKNGAPDAYCPWELTKDCRGIEWDGGEKAYRYIEWLQYIIDHVLKPAGVGIGGTVSYSGEDVTDAGIIAIEGGQVKQTELADVGDELEELSSFRDIVLNSEYGDELLRVWNKRKR